MEVERLAWLVAGACTLAACLLVGQTIRLHASNFVRPQEQKHAIVILAMVPLFALDSFIGLLDIDAAESTVMILDSIKECFEAVVIHSFLSLMFAYLRISPDKVPEHLLGRVIHQTAPFSYFMADMKMERDTVARLVSWTKQFVVLRPILSILSLVLELTGNLDRWSLPISLVLNVSVTTAVYALMLMYHAFEHELAQHRPLAQFLSIKGVVFFSFWQYVILQLLVHFKVLHSSHWYSVDEIETAIQNFLVCVECGLLFSFSFRYAFTAEPYLPGRSPAAAAAKKEH